MSKLAATRAAQVLSKAGIAFTAHVYTYDADADRVALQAAEAVGAAPSCVLKTLMALVDGRAVCLVVPSDRELSMKKVAAAFGGKAAQMMKPADAERSTGYRVGGISPFGQKKQVPTAFEAAALTEDQVYINGGQRGYLVRLAPADAVACLGANSADLVT
ncbi:hypothetical protein AA103196_1448 [Ameyamaea chiangmaiensis NBRC 103196]|uniref:Cys-tRNA(Pro)/Cys-tRNA(Cys) deacylase n=1 Tax=Ameyamaea chiangmaiensis TaxID=442969 RepID=A0A850PGY2_9PROT|nr:Cys-tRNA(Pro) deacylase [Ameyamaea chiangmaiensis]MBS4075270.1 Cys-tRNA(Pro) deacylase [Ameyamaea chiangmaiensis]NVN40421.1 Cys-tRNA(Pro) deacylase [Ameyamaea chiangmaiensis]GBQ66607.1 hypothetical protein AA103196_1448 [Ameyamaea chiangmaiensis NBRC 103196]